MSLYYIGVDPGVAKDSPGAIACISEDSVEIWDLPAHDVWGRRHLDVGDRVLDRFVSNFEYEEGQFSCRVFPPKYTGMVVLEKPGAYAPDASVVFQQAHCFGALEAIFRLYRNRIVEPRQWQGHYLNGSGRAGWSKDFALESARGMFPEAEDYLTRKKDHNRAEALLLAAYGRDLHQGGES